MLKGLTQKEVSERVAQGKINKTKDRTSKSISEIISSNIFTLFNIINLALAILIAITGEFQNMLFMGVVVFNTAIGIFQEVRAKIKLDRLKLLNEPHAKVIRDDKEVTIDGDEIVLDDLLALKLGDQVLADCILLTGEAATNESLLTGESNEIIKDVGDTLYAGSFITQGSCLCRVTKVGEDNYIDHILAKAKREKRQPSRLYDALNFIVRSITIIIVPLGALLFLKQYFLSDVSFDEAIIQTAASMIGMIPEGLILLTSVALSVGALKLSYKNTLAQSLYSLETLARTDVICFDKTGTITTGEIIVEDIKLKEEFDLDLLSSIVYGLNDENPTAKALRAYLKESHDHVLEKKYPFSSKSKYSGADVNGHRYLFGAYSFIGAKIDKTTKEEIERYTKEGYRTLAIAKDDRVIGYIIMRDGIRSEAAKTIAYFYDQNTELKIISGDDAKTVSHIAKQVGIKQAHAAIDCSSIDDETLKVKVLEASVFGRVTPDQKLLMIETLKAHGHTVGMVGDGVNDVMALKEADCSVSMYSGADSAKNVADIVLMDDDFAHMPDVVLEGRRVINNIERTASLFLIKTVMSILLAVLSIFVLEEYPFAPIQLTLVSSLCIGFPSFVLTFMPNYKKVTGDFLANILTRAIPSALAIVIVGIILELLSKFGIVDKEFISSMYTLIMGAIVTYNIYAVSKPLNFISTSLIVIAIGGLSLAYIFLKDLFYFETLDITSLIIAVILAVLGIFFLKLIEKLDLASRFASKIDDLY